jgi:hypothetical protein
VQSFVLNPPGAIDAAESAQSEYRLLFPLFWKPYRRYMVEGKTVLASYREQ